MNDLGIKIGFIGAGNMGEALAAGLLNAGAVSAESVFLCDTHNEKAVKIAAKYGFSAANALNIAKSCNIIVVAVKPNDAKDLLEDIAEYLTDEAVIVSIVTGLSAQMIVDIIGRSRRVVRVMPNTAVKVGEGMSAICRGGGADDSDINMIKKIFSCVGKVLEVNEKDMDAVTGVSGSSPAFIFQVIEAMSDAGVMAGLSRDNAIMLSAQAVLGAAKMVLESGMHPAALKDMVTSPAGTTIEGVYMIEKGGVRAAFIEAVSAAVKRSKDINNK